MIERPQTPSQSVTDKLMLRCIEGGITPVMHWHCTFTLTHHLSANTDCRLTKCKNLNIIYIDTSTHDHRSENNASSQTEA